MFTIIVWATSFWRFPGRWPGDEFQLRLHKKERTTAGDDHGEAGRAAYNGAERVADTRSHTGEGPLWHPGEERLYWVDIPAGRLYACDPVASVGGDVPELRSRIA